MKIFRVVIVNIIIIVSFFLTFEFIGRGYFYLKHGYTLKQSFLYRNDETQVYTLNPEYKGVRGLHYMGTRELYFEKDKGDKFRIICLGGSTTYGHAQFDRSKVWPKVLERLLNQGVSKSAYEVLNAGVPGHGSSNLAARLQKEILDLEPDLIIIFTGWNLTGSVKSKYAWVPDNIYHAKQPVLKKINNFLVDNSIWYIKMRAFLTVRSGQGRLAKMEEMISKIYKSELPALRNNLGQMSAICKDNGIIPVLIKYPSRDYSYQRYADTISAIEKTALRDDIYLIDCSQYFGSLNEEERAGYFVDMAHFSDKGQEKIADMIYTALIGKGLIN